MAARKQPVTVLAAAKTGDRLATLEAMRDNLAEAMDVCPEGARAQTAKVLQGVLEQIAELSPGSKVRTVDELRSRRDARLPDPHAARKATGTAARQRG